MEILNDHVLREHDMTYVMFSALKIALPFSEELEYLIFPDSTFRRKNRWPNLVLIFDHLFVLEWVGVEVREGREECGNGRLTASCEKHRTFGWGNTLGSIYLGM